MMKKFIFILFLFPFILNAQFKETKEISNEEIGSFYDKARNAPFSFSKIDNIYKLCFYNSVSTNTETQMTCISLNESDKSLQEFYDFVLEMFYSNDNSLEKFLETSQYKIKISKFFLSISLKFHDKNSNIRNNRSITSNFMIEDWKKLFGKK